MNRIALEETTLSIPDLAKLAEQGTVILTHNGKPLAAVKLLAGNDWESVSLANSPQFLALIEESRRSYCEQGGISLEQVRAQLGLTAKRTRGTRAKRKPKQK